MEKHYRIKEEFWAAWGVNCEEDAIIDVCTLNSHARKSGIRQHLLLAQVEDIVDEPAYRTPYEFIADLFDSGYFDECLDDEELSLTETESDICGMLDSEWGVPADLTPELYNELALEKIREYIALNADDE